TGATVLTYTGHSDAVYAVAWSTSGSRIVSGGQDQTAQIWDATSGRLIFTYRGHATTTQTPDHLPTGLVHCLAWSPDGARIASASLDHTVHIWSAS
ncbi:MAG: WD40 repeat domain-containing protein, partial [Ktedonobacterales bacterium]